MNGADAKERDATLRRRILIVRNPTAGVTGQRLVDAVVAGLERSGCRVVLRPTPDAGSVATIAAEAADIADAVVGAGGDGTIRALGKAFAAVPPSRRVPIGIIPVGTGNVMAREIGLPTEADALAGVLSAGPVVRITGGLANGEPFFLMVGVGFDGAVVAALSSRVKRRWGRAAYAAPVLATLAAPPCAFDVEIDGEARRASWVIVTNASRYGGAFTVTERTGLLQPGLVAVLMRSRTRLQRLVHLAALGLGRLDATAGVDVVPCRRIVVSATDVGATGSTPVQVDGDVFGTAPVTIVADGPVLDLIVPARFAGGALHAADDTRARSRS